MKRLFTPKEKKKETLLAKQASGREKVIAYQAAKEATSKELEEYERNGIIHFSKESLEKIFVQNIKAANSHLTNIEINSLLEKYCKEKQVYVVNQVLSLDAFYKKIEKTSTPFNDQEIDEIVQFADMRMIENLHEKRYKMNRITQLSRMGSLFGKNDPEYINMINRRIKEIQMEKQELELISL